MNLSIVIITHNEEQNIARTIQAAQKISDDIIVVDSFSADKTFSIATELGAKVFRKKWEGYSAQKNFGNEQAQYDFILSIDADEVISEALAENIKAEIEKPAYDCYDISFKTNFCGKWIRFGAWNPESHIRLFNKKMIRWNTAEVHEGLTLTKDHRIGKLKGYIEHYTVHALEKFLEKKNYYTTLHAELMYKKGKKASWIKLYLSPLARFFTDYFIKLGFLDGFHGFLIAEESANYVFMKYSKLKMLHYKAGLSKETE